LVEKVCEPFKLEDFDSEPRSVLVTMFLAKSVFFRVVSKSSKKENWKRKYFWLFVQSLGSLYQISFYTVKKSKKYTEGDFVVQFEGIVRFTFCAFL
jgi:hypothetical protein